MLSITPSAWRALEDLTHQRQGSGVRLARTDTGALHMDVAEGPEQDDTVVWSLGTVVWVDRAAAVDMDHAVLDLRSTPGSQAFYLR